MAKSFELIDTGLDKIRQLLLLVNTNNRDCLDLLGVMELDGHEVFSTQLALIELILYLD